VTDIRRLDLNLLVTLEALLEERNVSRAAQRLALSQSTVSGMLSRLRLLVDDELFVRSSRGVIPTARAEGLKDPVHRLLAEARSLIEPETFDPAITQREFVLSATDYMQQALLAPLIGLIRGLAPRARVKCRPLDRKTLPSALSEGQVDIAIMIPEWATDDLMSRHLYREHYVLVMGRQNPLARGPLTLEQFLDAGHIVLSPNEGGFVGDADVALAECGLSRNVGISLSNFLVVPSVVRQSDLVALVPSRLLRAEDPSLHVCAPPFDAPEFDVIAVWHPRYQKDPAHRWLRGLLAKVADASAR
jgi:DNA-binding transcriptional LysR family regulator